LPFPDDNITGGTKYVHIVFRVNEPCVKGLAWVLLMPGGQNLMMGMVKPIKGQT